MASQHLTKPQIELLNAFAYLDTDQDVYQLKKVLSDFFAKRAEEEMDRLWSSGEWDLEKLESLRDQHFRTTYK